MAGILGPVHASAKGEPAWPPLAMFKALLRSVWYDLRDTAHRTTGMWGRDEQETLRQLKEWNQPIHRVRGGMRSEPTQGEPLKLSHHIANAPRPLKPCHK